MFLVSSCICLCPIHWSRVLCQEWRCSWGSTDRRCSNYIWVINNFIAYWGVAYIRGFTIVYLRIYVSLSLSELTKLTIRTSNSDDTKWEHIWLPPGIDTESAQNKGKLQKLLFRNFCTNCVTHQHIVAIGTGGYCHRFIRPPAHSVCPSRMTLPLFQWFQLLAWNLVWWCTAPWSRLLHKMASLSQFLHILRNFEIFHGRLGRDLSEDVTDFGRPRVLCRSLNVLSNMPYSVPNCFCVYRQVSNIRRAFVGN